METVLNLLFNAENMRMLLLVVFGFSGFMLLKASIKELRADMNASIKELRADMETSIKELKYNDIAHLNSSIEALTYALEKNGYLKKEDKEFVDSRLAH